MKPRRSARSSRVVTSIPPTMSEWPFKYLVVEWSTMSAPNCGGCGVAAVHERERESEPCPDVRHLPVRPTVHVFTAHDVIARRQQFYHGVERRQPGAERESVQAALQRGHVALERLARGIAGAGILVALVTPQSLLDIGGGLVDGRHHRAA